MTAFDRDLAVLRRAPQRQCGLCGARVRFVGSHVLREHRDVLAHPISTRGAS